MSTFEAALGYCRLAYHRAAPEASRRDLSDRGEATRVRGLKDLTKAAIFLVVYITSQTHLQEALEPPMDCCVRDVHERSAPIL